MPIPWHADTLTVTQCLRKNSYQVRSSDWDSWLLFQDCCSRHASALDLVCHFLRRVRHSEWWGTPTVRKVWASSGVLWQVVCFTFCRGGEWEAIDLKDVVVHIFTAEQRERYSLDEYYAQAEVCSSIWLLTSLNFRLRIIPGMMVRSLLKHAASLAYSHSQKLVQNARGCCESASEVLEMYMQLPCWRSLQAPLYTFLI